MVYSKVKQAFGTNGQALTITLASLANAAARESTVVDNTTNVFLDALLMVKVKNGASAPTGDKAVYVYAYGTADNGTTYPDTVTGADAAITLNSPTQLVLVGVVKIAAANTTYKAGPFSIAGAFGGVLPAKWGVVLLNKIGGALSATGGDHAVIYQGIYAEVTQ